MTCARCGASLPDAASPCPQCGDSAPGFEPTRVRPASADSTPGATVLLEGKWALEERLGAGGMGAVWRARDVALDRVVAVKLLSPALASTPEFVARFEREARMMAKFDHPNLIPVYAVGRHEGAPFIVMKYLEGATLHDFIRARGRLAVDEVVAVARQVCAGLEYVHGKGSVHRDLKPANIFVAPDGQVTILDLGLMRAREPSGSAMTRTGALLGTPAYMAPEQIVGAKDVDHRCDLYALGVILYEMLTGTPPFAADSEFSMMKAHLDAAPPDPTRLAPNAPPGLGSVILRALAKQREDRFGSAGELFRAVEAACRGAGPAPSQTQGIVGAPIPPTVLRATPTPASIHGPHPSATPATRPEASRGPASGPAAGAALDGAFPAPTAGLGHSGLAQLAGARGVSAGVVAIAAFVVVGLAGGVVAWRIRAARVDPAVATAERPREAPLSPPPPVPSPTSPAVGSPSATPPDPRPSVPRPTAAIAPRTSAARAGELRVVTLLGGKSSWAWLDIDGRRQPDPTPLTVRLSAGRHQVRMVREGYRPVERVVEVASGKPLVLRLELVP